MEAFRVVSLFAVAGLSLCMDLKSGKIPNGLIVCGWCMGLLYHLLKWNWIGVLTFIGEAGFPLIVWGIFYYFRMIGAGDVKLFSVLGAFLGISLCGRLMLSSVFLGGIIAAGLLVVRGNLYWRISYFQCYVESLIRKEGWKSYREGETKESTFHFTVPIFVSVLLLLGGII